MSLQQLHECESLTIAGVFAALGVMKDVLRTFPQHSRLVLTELPNWIRKMEDANAKASCIWMVGEFGNTSPLHPLPPAC